jgi:DNA processing protein
LDEIILLLSFHPKIGSRSIEALAQEQLLGVVLELSTSELKERGVPDKLIGNITEVKDFSLTEIKKRLDKYGIEFFTFLDVRYPTLLKEIPDRPYLLFYKGDLDTLKQRSISIVGSRKATAYGRQVTRDLVGTAVKGGLAIVSGLALGIDGSAHQAALDYQGTTIAVLGNGLHTIYPANHTHLAESILNSGGLILSEYPPGTPSFPGNFPMRNRIIAGLSEGTVIIEANQKSGSLLTARASLDYNREVFSIPHNWYDSTGQGPNNLIKMGATILTQPDDLLELFGIDLSQKKKVKTAFDSVQQEQIWKLFADEPMHIDQIIDQSNLVAAEVNSNLTLMEMKGLIRHLGGNQYLRID